MGAPGVEGASGGVVLGTFKRRNGTGGLGADAINADRGGGSGACS